MLSTDDPKNPSVPYAQAFDARCPDGKPAFVVFFRQGAESKPADWVMERTSDGTVLASGSLEDILSLVGTEEYPHSRRATHAEDTLRFKAGVFYVKMEEPLTRRIDYSNVEPKKIVDSTPEELREMFKDWK